LLARLPRQLGRNIRLGVAATSVSSDRQSRFARPAVPNSTEGGACGWDHLLKIGIESIVVDRQSKRNIDHVGARVSVSGNLLECIFGRAS
jgi:hypothetical protein